MTASANNTTLTPTFITDSVGNVWSLVGGSATRGTQIALNGVVQTYTGFVVLMLYFNQVVYQENSSGGWWYWNNSTAAWVATSDPRIAPSATISGITLSNSSFVGGSAAGTVIGTVGVTMSSGSFSGTLALSGANASSFSLVGNNIVTNGVVPAGSYSVSITATQAGATNSPFTQTYTLTGTTTVQAITGITLSNSSVAGGSASGTLIGTIAVSMSSGTFSGALSLSGTDAAKFQIVGNNLETNGVLNAGSYSVTINATQAGATGSPYSTQFAITGTSVNNNWWTTPPPQAAAVGYKTLKFGDDFTSASTITLTNSSSPRNFNWYPASWGGAITNTMVQVNTSWKANDANMQAQGVSATSATLNNMSPNGGIVRLQGGASNATLISVDGWLTTFPTTGVFQHAYFEAYLQYRPHDLNTSNSGANPSLGWPGWWSWSMENIRGLGFGGSPFSGTYTEIDFWEYAVASNGIAWGGSALHGSMSGGGYSYTQVALDNNWHTIGCLWTPGNIKWYYDNIQVGAAGGIATSTALESEHQFIMIGCGLTSKPPFTIPMFVDWVRVWTAS